MNSKTERVYFVSHSEFDGHEFLGHGLSSFVYNHPSMTSPRDWLSKMFDVCMDADFAIVFMCDRCAFDGRLITFPVFMYDDFQGYMLNFRDRKCVGVVDPSLEDYDCLLDDYDSFCVAALHTCYDSAGNAIFHPEGMDKKYFVQAD